MRALSSLRQWDNLHLARHSLVVVAKQACEYRVFRKYPITYPTAASWSCPHRAGASTSSACPSWRRLAASRDVRYESRAGGSCFERNIMPAPVPSQEEIAAKVREGPNIWIAAGDGDLDRVKLLLEHGGVTPTSADFSKYTPIHAAASYGRAELLCVFFLTQALSANLPECVEGCGECYRRRR